MISRKKMLKMLATMPILGGLASANLITTASGSKLKYPAYRRDFFTELGLRTFINARGTHTVLTASLMEEEVLEAMNYAAQQYVNLDDLNRKVGERIAEMLNCEDAMVTAGAASALTLGTAATITGKNQELIRLLPNLPGPRREVIIQSSHRFVYDHAVRNCGVKMIEVDSARDMRKKINENTVMALYFNAAREHLIEREEFVKIGRRYNITTFNDAAADVPPVENLFKYIEMGFDLVTFSGGKGLRGPQSTGLLYGRSELIEAARLNHSPNGDTIGRGMKVNKEEILGMMVALEKYLNKDHEKEWAEWERRVELINRHAGFHPSVEAEMHVPEGPSNFFPGSRIRWDEDKIQISPSEVVEALRYGHPSIESDSSDDTLVINVHSMKPEEAGIVGRRIREELAKAVA